MGLGGGAGVVDGGGERLVPGLDLGFVAAAGVGVVPAPGSGGCRDEGGLGGFGVSGSGEPVGAGLE